MQPVKEGRLEEVEMAEISQDPVETPRLEEPFNDEEQRLKPKKSCFRKFTTYFNTE